MEVRGRRGRRGQELLDDLKETQSCWKLKDEALDRTQRRTRFGSGYGLVVLFSIAFKFTIHTPEEPFILPLYKLHLSARILSSELIS